MDVIPFSQILATFTLLWAVIDPFGTLPVFLAVTKRHPDREKSAIAIRAVIASAGILIFFIAVGQFILEGVGVPLDAFQIAGGIVLFLFALSMIFGEGKPEAEVEIVRSHKETAIFPLAVPSIASPGAMMAVVMLTDNHRFSVPHQIMTTFVMLVILVLTLGLLLSARWIYKLIGDSGASIVSRVMGMILASVAANSVLAGIKSYFAVGA